MADWMLVGIALLVALALLFGLLALLDPEAFHEARRRPAR